MQNSNLGGGQVVKSSGNQVLLNFLLALASILQLLVGFFNDSIGDLGGGFIITTLLKNNLLDGLKGELKSALLLRSLLGGGISNLSGRLCGLSGGNLSLSLGIGLSKALGNGGLSSGLSLLLRCTSGLLDVLFDSLNGLVNGLGDDLGSDLLRLLCRGASLFLDHVSELRSGTIDKLSSSLALFRGNFSGERSLLGGGLGDVLGGGGLTHFRSIGNLGSDFLFGGQGSLNGSSGIDGSGSLLSRGGLGIILNDFSDSLLLLGNDAGELSGGSLLSSLSHGILLSGNALLFNLGSLLSSLLLGLELGNTLSLLTGSLLSGSFSFLLKADSLLSGEFVSKFASGLLLSTPRSFILGSLDSIFAVLLSFESFFSAAESQVDSSFALSFESLDFFLSLFGSELTSSLLCSKTLSFFSSSFFCGESLSLSKSSFFFSLFLCSCLSLLFSLKTLLLLLSSNTGSFGSSSFLSSLALSLDALSLFFSETNGLLSSRLFLSFLFCWLLFDLFFSLLFCWLLFDLFFSLLFRLLFCNFFFNLLFNSCLLFFSSLNKGAILIKKVLNRSCALFNRLCSLGRNLLGIGFTRKDSAKIAATKCN